MGDDSAAPTFRQIMAARALLGWSHRALADQAGIDAAQLAAQLAALEETAVGAGSTSSLSAESISSMTTALRRAGIVFSGTAVTPGVSLTASAAADEGLRPDELNAQNDG